MNSSDENKKEIEDIYPLTPMQEGMLFHSLLDPDSGVYIEQMSVLIQGDLDVNSFVKAWQGVLDRHAILRSSFIWEEVEKPLQVVYKNLKIQIQMDDWSDFSTDIQEERLIYLQNIDRKTPFGFDDPPLMRFHLIRLNESQYRFIWSSHHILYDGWSLPILMKEVLFMYEGIHTGQQPQLEPVLNFREYIAWLQKQNIDQSKVYWENLLKNFEETTPFVVNSIPSLEKEIETGHKFIKKCLTRDQSDRLRTFTQQNGLTLNTIFQGAWGILLNLYTDKDDIVFGVIVSGRPSELPGSENMVGMFINNIPVRLYFPDKELVVDWLQNLQLQNIKSRQYEYTPLVQIQSWSSLSTNSPLFNSILIFENFPIEPALKEQRGSLSMRDVRHSAATNYPLTIIGGPGQEFELQISYDSSQIASENAIRLLNQLCRVVERLATTPETLSIKDLIKYIFSESDTSTLSGEEIEFGSEEKSVIKLIDRQAELNPQEIALIFSDERISYQELKFRTDSIGNYLRQLDLGDGKRIGVCLDRSSKLIICLLGILKAGYSYVPIDPGLPSERISFIVSDSSVEKIIVGSQTIDFFDAFSEKIISVDDVFTNIVKNLPPSREIDGEHLAYMIYTSGTTGKPKGVLVGHSQLLNHATNMAKSFNIRTGTRMLQFISISFDASGEEIYPILTNGGTLVIPPADLEPSGLKILGFCDEHKVEILHLPAAVWHQMVDDLDRNQVRIPASIKLLTIGGEKPLKSKLLTWTKALQQPMQCINLYGPTETTITALVFPFDLNISTIEKFNEIPVGKPIANVRVRIVSDDLVLCPIGVPGELLISGYGVAAGYHNQPKLTKDKFISFEGDRCYRTGDRVVLLEDGNIYFLGRTDEQVKWRGYRIELGEIEGALQQNDNIQEAVVVVNELSPGDKRLIAYLVTTEKGILTDRDVRDFLRKKIADYMIPSSFVFLEKMPLTLSGKVNKKALPGVDETILSDGKEYSQPSNITEEILCGIVEDILGLKQVSVNDSFFDLGGHSLLATQFVSRIRMNFNVDFELRKLFDHPSISGIAIEITNLRSEQKGISQFKMDQIARSQDLPLSFSQQRLWFIDQLDPGSSAFNIPTAVKLKGKFSVEALKKSLNILSQKHEMLRTVFPNEGGKPIQKILPEPNFEFVFNEEIRAGTSDIENGVKHWLGIESSKSFNLSSGPLIRVGVCRINDVEHIVLLTLHHIITDGWSMNIIVNELAEFYSSYVKEIPVEFDDLTIQYVDYAYWQKSWFQGEVFEEQIQYWKNQLSGIPQLINLPTDQPRPAIRTSNGRTQSFMLNQEKSQLVQSFCRKEGITLYMFLLSVFGILLHRYSGDDDICIGTAIANRNRPEVEKIIGFFVNNLVMRMNFSDDPTFRDLLAKIRETTLDAYSHQDLPFEMLVDTLQPRRNLSYTPLFQVGFDVQSTNLGSAIFEGVDVTPIQFDSGQSAYDMLLSMTITSEGIIGQFEYNTDLFVDDTIQRLISNIQKLIEESIQDQDIPVSYLPIISDDERMKILREWNFTAQNTDFNHCIHERFEAWVEKQPDHPALFFEGQILSYSALNQKANQLATHLRNIGVGPEKIVGVLNERSMETIISILAILKAGGAFLPLDPNYPIERIHYMIQDASHSQIDNSIFIITNEELAQKHQLDHTDKTIILGDTWDFSDGENPKNLPIISKPDNLAYVIYTSGSTGKPKGTQLIHRGLCNLSEVQKNIFEITPDSKILQFSPLSFDASVWETFMALGNGATLYLARQEVLSSGLDLLKFLKQEKISVVTLPPSLLAVLPNEDIPELRTIIAAGEACSKEIVERWGVNRNFFNAYGPTETTVCATIALCNQDDTFSPSIGKPLPNFQVFIVDRNLKPTPIGVPGELLIGGPGVARGYINQSQLTKEKFIFNPFSTSGKLYRTGDLVRYRNDGNVEFLGRIDQQVKVRGFRIELGEIEHALRQAPGVGDAVVIVREDNPGDKRLVGYLVPVNGIDESAIHIQDVKENIRKILPEYMVPGFLMILSSFPLSPSGKVDRKALPHPESQPSDLSIDYVAPRTPIEIELCHICEELLSKKEVGIFHNFFELGGHSLLATQFMSRIRDKFTVELPLRVLFEHPTVAELSLEIEKIQHHSTQNDIPTMKPVSRENRRIKRSELESKE